MSVHDLTLYKIDKLMPSLHAPSSTKILHSLRLMTAYTGGFGLKLFSIDVVLVLKSGLKANLMITRVF